MSQKEIFPKVLEILQVKVMGKSSYIGFFLRRYIFDFKILKLGTLCIDETQNHVVSVVRSFNESTIIYEFFFFFFLPRLVLSR